MFEKEIWTKLAAVFAKAEFAFDKIEIRRSTGDESAMLGALSIQGGRFTTTRDGGFYSDKADAPVEVIHIVVPIRLNGWQQADGPLELQLIESYRQRASDGAWVPYRAGVYDPAGKARSLPVPWL
ncbi:MAG: hypothetical protein IT431_10565 [Phycisphaerales bacterium]|nr:hypothetical protein [Phycisphaerales bacterium]